MKCIGFLGNQISVIALKIGTVQYRTSDARYSTGPCRPWKLIQKADVLIRWRKRTADGRNIRWIHAPGSTRLHCRKIDSRKRFL